MDYQEAEEELMLAKQARHHPSIRYYANAMRGVMRTHTHTRTHRACTLLQAAEDFRNFRSARRATRRVVSKLPLSGRAAPRRAPLAAMMAMRGQGWTLAKPKAKPAEAGAEEAEVEAEVEAAE